MTISRRDAVAALGASVGASMLNATPLHADARADLAARVRAGRLKQSVARWCFARMPIADLCAGARDAGLVAIDLLSENEWAVPAQFGLACAIGNGFGTIPKGFNRLDQHDELVAAGEAMIPKAATSTAARCSTTGWTRGTSCTNTGPTPTA